MSQKNISYLKYITVFAALFSTSVEARPVSYPGGVMAMVNNDFEKNMVEVNYSTSAYESFGYMGEYWREEEWQFHGLSYNRLLKRWNNFDSQANWYVKSAVGVAHSDYKNNNSRAFDNEVAPAGFVGTAIDWEDRRFFTMYENRVTEAGSIADGFSQMGRVGVAPYVGDFGDVHTWLMLQLDHDPEADDKYKLTPLVRFFYDTNLMEIGVSEDETVMFNFVKTF